MGSPDGRREPRYRVRLSILVTIGGRSVALATEDVSRGGIFLRTDQAMPVRQVAHVELVLPPRAERFLATGTLRHIVPRGFEGRLPGAGLQLDAIGPQAQATWLRFIEHARTHFPEAGERAQIQPRGETFEPLHHRKHGDVAVLRVHPTTLAELCTMYERDVARGGMFLLTDESFRVGDEIGLQIIHPHTMDVFETACTVWRTVNEHGVAGVGVEFIDPEASGRCYDFIYDGIAELFDDESFVDEEP